MTLEEFLRRHGQALNKNSPYERLFAEQVLGKLSGLDFASIQTQTPFVDSEGKDRRIDFTVQEGEHVRLALEVDGYDKRQRGSGMTRGEFRDWLQREQEIVRRGWRLLDLRTRRSSATQKPAR